MTQCHPKILIHVNKTSKLSSELAKKAKKIFSIRSKRSSKKRDHSPPLSTIDLEPSKVRKRPDYKIR